MPVWGCSAVSHYKLAHEQLNAAEIHLGAVSAVAQPCGDEGLGGS
jgi:hypothetical protein